MRGGFTFPGDVATCQQLNEHPVYPTDVVQLKLHLSQQRYRYFSPGMWHQSSHTKPWIIGEADSKNPAYRRHNQTTFPAKQTLVCKRKENKCAGTE